MICEHCKKPIRDGEEFYWTADECALHEACYPKKEFIADADRLFGVLATSEVAAEDVVAELAEAELKRRETK